MSSLQKIRVLVVDDSAVVRRAIADALSRDPEIEVVGSACDPYVARDKILELNPDVLTLDIEMPRMDGITFLKILQQHRPMPVIVISSLTQTGSTAALAALEAGAVDVLGKPNSSWSIGALSEQLAFRVKGAAKAKMARSGPALQSPGSVSTTRSFSPRQLVVLGASTGGTEAIKTVLTRLPANLPGICIVQHIPAVFSRAFAERLNDCCALEVREATQGEEVRPGRVLIAPGDFHMAVEWNGRCYCVRLHQGPPLHFTRPAVDVLFNSAAACAGSHALGVVLTGMGADGAQGMKKLKEAGAETIAQNEKTCVVYGMPRAAAELGVVDHVLPLDAIPDALVRALENRSGGSSQPRTSTGTSMAG